MPLARFAPDLFEIYSNPAFCSIPSIIREVVVLPFVPVTIIILNLSESLLKISGQILRAIFPGRLVPPLPTILRPKTVSLVIIMARPNLNFIKNFHTKTQKVNTICIIPIIYTYK